MSKMLKPAVSLIKKNILPEGIILSWLVDGRTTTSLGGEKASVHLFLFIPYPVKYTDPDGKYLINNLDPNAYSAKDYASNSRQIPRGHAYVFQPGTNPPLYLAVSPQKFTNEFSPFAPNIILDAKLTEAIDAAWKNRDKSNISVRAEKMDNGNYEIRVTVKINGKIQATGTVAYADKSEVLNEKGEIDNNKVNDIANDTINIVRKTIAETNNID